MTVLSEEQLRRMPFIFRECLLRNPREQFAEMGRKAHISRSTAKKYLEYFLKEGILYPPTNEDY